MTSAQQRAALQRQIWQIANDVRGAVDGWDFKQYVLGTLFYRFISENFSSYVEAGDEKTVLACFEEGLRHDGLGAVVGEVARLSMTASRRLHLAAEGSGTMGIAVRRWRRQAEAADFGQPTAATTRWRVTALPSSPLPAAGVGRPRWFIELIRCKAGECADFELEACDETGRLALPADLADRSLAATPWQRRAAG